MRVTLNEESQTLWQSQNLEHLRYEYDLKPDDVVIDIGAYRGEWASGIYQRYGCNLVMVEPGPWIIGCKAGEIINQAAWTRDGGLQFGGDHYYTSAYEPATHGYSCFDINSLLAKYDEIALVKINIEGAEYNLLSHIIRANMHQRIRNLQVQFHQIEGEPWQAWYDAIAIVLRYTHVLEWRYPFCWESWERA